MRAVSPEAPFCTLPRWRSPSYEPSFRKLVTRRTSQHVRSSQNNEYPRGAATRRHGAGRGLAVLGEGWRFAAACAALAA
eukprot:15461674-Alexandrium_andersonii.AAC.1